MRYVYVPAIAAFMVAGLATAQIATAETVTIDFNHYAERGAADICGQVANVSYCDKGKFLYDNTSPDILIGDYDWAPGVKFKADPGSFFTPLRFDVLSAYSSVSRAPADCGLFNADCDENGVSFEGFLELRETNPGLLEPVETDYLTLTGLRFGEKVASVSLRPEKGQIVEFGSEFANLDELMISVDAAYSNASVYPRIGDYFYGCAGWQGTISLVCNELRFDNLTIDTFMPEMSVTPAPLPASIWLLGGALGGVAGWRRLSRRARVRAA